MNGFNCGLEQYPAKNKDSCCKSYLPNAGRLWTKPNQGQSQRPHTTDRKDNKRFSEVPWNLFLFEAWGVACNQKLTAVFTLYCVILNFFSTEGTGFHFYLNLSHRYHRFSGMRKAATLLSIPRSPLKIQEKQNDELG